MYEQTSRQRHQGRSPCERHLATTCLDALALPNFPPIERSTSMRTRSYDAWMWMHVYTKMHVFELVDDFPRNRIVKRALGLFSVLCNYSMQFSRIVAFANFAQGTSEFLISRMQKFNIFEINSFQFTKDCAIQRNNLINLRTPIINNTTISLTSYYSGYDRLI